mmetsp:Transcript_11252/g.25579  ORF Transcript_11252/g.25579 Transcript_11252/m.25579 type:complete len:220 (+) Transcript_11252:504-1163(+)
MRRVKPIHWSPSQPTQSLVGGDNKNARSLVELFVPLGHLGQGREGRDQILNFRIRIQTLGVNSSDCTISEPLQSWNQNEIRNRRRRGASEPVRATLGYQAFEESQMARQNVVIDRLPNSFGLFTIFTTEELKPEALLILRDPNGREHVSLFVQNAVDKGGLDRVSWIQTSDLADIAHDRRSLTKNFAIHGERGDLAVRQRSTRLHFHELFPSEPDILEL